MSIIEAKDAASVRIKLIVLVAALVVMCLFCLCFSTAARWFVSPAHVIECYGLWFQQLYCSFADPGSVLAPIEITTIIPDYYQVINQAGVTFVTALSGCLLALAGTLYQNVFRNPIASPSMLGVSSGIQVGLVILVAIFGLEAAGMFATRYLFCYVAVIIVLALVFALSKLMTIRGQSVSTMNILLVAMMVAALADIVSAYISAYFFDIDQWFVYSGLVEVVAVNTSTTAIAVLVGSTIISVIPVALLRFRLNMLSFSDADMRLLGVKPSVLRAIALVCGTIMMLASELAVGTVALISLVVPNISRALFGAEFRRQFAGNCLIGACLLTLCRIISFMVPYVSGGFPIGVVVSFVVLPAFV